MELAHTCQRSMQPDVVPTRREPPASGSVRRHHARHASQILCATVISPAACMRRVAARSEQRAGRARAPCREGRRTRSCASARSRLPYTVSCFRLASRPRPAGSSLSALSATLRSSSACRAPAPLLTPRCLQRGPVSQSHGRPTSEAAAEAAGTDDLLNNPAMQDMRLRKAAWPHCRLGRRPRRHATNAATSLSLATHVYWHIVPVSSSQGWQAAALQRGAQPVPGDAPSGS